jgi:hypothetical protein
LGKEFISEELHGEILMKNLNIGDYYSNKNDYDAGYIIDLDYENNVVILSTNKVEIDRWNYDSFIKHWEKL